MERGEWLTSTPVWLDRPVQKEEGRQKSDRHRIGAMPSRGGGGRDAVLDHGVDLQLRTMESIGDMAAEAHEENLCTPLAAYLR